MGIQHRESGYLRVHYLRAYKAPLYFCREHSTNQPFFMQNKANVKDAQMNINTFVTMRYAKIDIWLFGKNKANSKPTKPNLSQFQCLSKPYKANSNPKQTQSVARFLIFSWTDAVKRLKC
jgi:hypothetical protein